MHHSVSPEVQQQSEPIIGSLDPPKYRFHHIGKCLSSKSKLGAGCTGDGRDS